MKCSIALMLMLLQDEVVQCFPAQIPAASGGHGGQSSYYEDYESFGFLPVDYSVYIDEDYGAGDDYTGPPINSHRDAILDYEVSTVYRVFSSDYEDDLTTTQKSVGTEGNINLRYYLDYNSLTGLLAADWRSCSWPYCC